MRVYGPDVLEVERRLELSRGQRHMLSTRADGRSGMLLVSSSTSSSLGEDSTWFSLQGGVLRTLLSCLDSMRSGGEKGWMT